MKYILRLLGLSTVLILAACQTTSGASSAGLSADKTTAINATYTQSAEALLARDDVQIAFQTIEDDRARNNLELVELNEIPAPPFGEETRAAHLANMFKTLGLSVEIDDVGNVIARRAGRDGGKTVAIGAHIDTVFPIETNVKVKRGGDLFTAPGIGDNTRGLVVLLSLIRALDAANIQTKSDLLFIGNIGEEGLGDLRGIKHLYREGADHPDTFIAIDGGQLNRLIHAGVGSSRYRITYQGPGGHSWGDFGMANPHHALARAITKFAETAPEVTSAGPKSSFSVGRIGGGTSINSIPFESWMEVDMRSGDVSKIADVEAKFLTAVKDGLEAENNARNIGPELTVNIDKVGDRPAGTASPQSPLVQNAMAAMTSLGLKPELAVSSTDANIPISMGKPAITISRGGISRGAHSLEESWEDVEAHKGIQLALSIALLEAGIVATK